MSFLPRYYILNYQSWILQFDLTFYVNKKVLFLPFLDNSTILLLLPTYYTIICSVPRKEPIKYINKFSEHMKG